MSFSQQVINWYKIHKRDLPWRKSTDPYIIWLSEIILQQTRVEQGTPYFYRFAETYPTIKDFAEAHEDEILKLWQGLGYYSRGRNMHRTAQIVMEEHGGYFPKDYDSLIKLKGIGEYTAAAISSFTANEAKAVVDGNVFRVLSRYFGIFTPINSTEGKKQFSTLANELLDPAHPALHNQAIMEFGALQCRPRNPLCETCPLITTCYAYTHHEIEKLPVKLKKQQSKDRYFNYFYIQNGDEVLMNKRGARDIWQNLYELPLIETEKQYSANELIRTKEFIQKFNHPTKIELLYGPVKHILSHQNIYAQFIQMELKQPLKEGTDWFYVDMDKVDLLAQPKLIFTFFKNLTTLK